MTQRTEYTFNASAIALGGYFTRGGRQILVPSLASVALAPTGGEGWANVTNYDQDGIAFTRAESRVSGYETSRNFFTTYSDIYITNLSVFDTVRVAMMHATVTSTRDTNCPADEATFQLHASYRGIEIDGYEVVPEIDIHTCGADYRTLLKKALAELPDADRNLSVASRRDALERGEPIRDTIVKGLKQNGERKVALRNEANHVIAAPGFGTIHFGELLVKRGRRRVNLLRFDFGDRHDRGPKKKYQLHSDQQHAETYTVDADQLNDETPEHRMSFLAQTSSMRPDSGSLTIASGDGNGEPVWPGRNG